MKQLALKRSKMEKIAPPVANNGSPNRGSNGSSPLKPVAVSKPAPAPAAPSCARCAEAIQKKFNYCPGCSTNRSASTSTDLSETPISPCPKGRDHSVLIKSTACFCPGCGTKLPAKP